MKMSIKKSIAAFIASSICLQAIPLNVFAEIIPPQKNYVIQIVADGLSDTLFDQLKAKGAKTPNIDQLIYNGSRFRNVETTVPSHTASAAAGMTGASPQKNDCLIEYSDISTSTVKTGMFNMKAETIFNKLFTDKAVNGIMASSWRVNADRIDSDKINGFPKGDSNFVLKYSQDKLGDELTSITTVTDEILLALGSTNIPQYISVYSNDITRIGWVKIPPDQDLITALELIDTQIGRINQAVNQAGISSTTTIILSSLANATKNDGKVSAVTLANDITNATGVQVLEENFTGKASIQKQYYTSHTQLYFMPSATEADKTAVLNYLATRTDVVERLATPQEFGLPASYADYIICPIQGKSFCYASGGYFRVDELHNNKVFFVMSGTNAPKRSSINKVKPTILDIVPTICSILGANVPKDNEGTAWTYSPLNMKPVLTIATPENNKTVYKPQIEISGILDYPCEVRINDQVIPLNGVKFASTYTLIEGQNTITVTATNEFGTTREDLLINYIIPPVAPKGNRTVYINFDGFARYYIDEALKTNRNIPTIKNIIQNEGVFFTNANTHIPSITNPTQQAIVSGTPPLFTDNHYRYFHKEKNIVIQENPARKDEAETIAESAVRQNLDVVSINQFALENRGTTSTDQRALYIDAGNTDARFNAITSLVKDRTLAGYTFDEVPRFIALYVDDLDGIGHNANAILGYSIATTEAERMANILNRLEILDKKLGDFIQVCKDAGIYDSTSFVLTADHGMSPFGRQEVGGDNYNSSLDDMIRIIESLGAGYKCQVLFGGEAPAADTNIAIVSVGLQAQLTYVNEFNPDVIASKNARITEAVKNEVYVDAILTPSDLKAEGMKENFADLLISPKPPYSFKTGDYEKLRIAQVNMIVITTQPRK